MRCAHCKTQKPQSAFRRNKRRIGGRQPWCIPCSKRGAPEHCLICRDHLTEVGVRGGQLTVGKQRGYCRRCYTRGVAPLVTVRTSAGYLTDRFQKQFERRYVTPEGRAVHLLNNARRRARVLGVGFALTPEWLEPKLAAGVCEVSGLPLVLRLNGGKGHRENSFSPSLDRIDRTGPYTPENVRVVCWIYNRARGAFPDTDFEKLVDALVQKRLMPSSQVDEERRVG